MAQVAQITGALLILGGFVGSQRGMLSPHALAYLALNFAGSAVLTVVALAGSDWGFLLLEGVWAVVSLWGLAGLAGRRARPRRAAAAHAGRDDAPLTRDGRGG
jgi:hypothetical protein